MSDYIKPPILLVQNNDDFVVHKQLLRSRIVAFTGTIDEGMTEEFRDQLTWLAIQNDDPIYVYVTSEGGDVFKTLALYDHMRSIIAMGTPITTVGQGEVASGAGILLQGGSTRLVAPHTWMLIHEIRSISFGSTSENEDEVKLCKRIQKQFAEILAARSTLSPADIERKSKRVNWWLNAEDVIKYKLADGYAVS